MRVKRDNNKKGGEKGVCGYEGKISFSSYTHSYAPIEIDTNEVFSLSLFTTTPLVRQLQKMIIYRRKLLSNKTCIMKGNTKKMIMN